MLGRGQQWAMMMRTFSLLVLAGYCNVATASPLVMSFDVETSNSGSVQVRADALANRIVRDNAYLAFTDENSFQPCWMKFIVGREISIHTVLVCTGSCTILYSCMPLLPFPPTSLTAHLLVYPKPQLTSTSLHACVNPSTHNLSVKEVFPTLSTLPLN